LRDHGRVAVTVVYECETCWARAATPEGIEHQAIKRHPAEPVIHRFEFPIVMQPSSGMFGRV